MMHEILLSLTGLSLILGQGARISIAHGVNIYAFEVLIVIHVIMMSAQLSRELIRRRDPLVYVICFWFGLAVLVLLSASAQSPWIDTARAGMYLARLGLYVVYAWMLSGVSLRQKHVHTIVRVLIYAIPLICIIQYVFIPDLRFLARWGWDPHMYRAVGTMLDPPIVGSVLGILMIAALIYRERLASLANFIAIVFLFSRSTYLAVCIVVASYLLSQRRWMLTVMWGIALGVGIVAAPMTIPRGMTLESAKIDRVSTVGSRWTEISKGLMVWRQHPIVGIGYNRIPQYKKTTTVEKYASYTDANHASSAYHSFWVTQLATTGILGVMILLAVLLMISLRYPLMTFAFAVPSIIGIFDNVLFHPFVLVLLIVTSVAGVWRAASSPSIEESTVGK